MERKVVVKFLICFILIQQKIIGTDELPLDDQNATISIDPDNGQRLWLPEELQGLDDNYIYDVTSPPRYLNVQTQTEKNATKDHLRTLYLDLEARRVVHLIEVRHLKMLCYKAHIYGTVDFIFMMSVLTVLCFHIFFLDIFIRFTRPRFENSNRYRLLAHINRLLSFLMFVACFLLLLMHYKESI